MELLLKKIENFQVREKKAVAHLGNQGLAAGGEGKQGMCAVPTISPRADIRQQLAP